MTRNLLLAEQLALVALDAESGRHARGTRTHLNACLAGLLVAELVIDGQARRGDRDDTLVPAGASAEAAAPALAAAARVVADKGPRIKAVLSHMDRGLIAQLGRGTWDTAVAGLVDAGKVAPAAGGLRPHVDLVDRHRREVIVDRLRAAAADDAPLDPRTALLLAMTGPAHLLEVVAPERGARRHARRRIDHALDGTPFEPVAKIVRRLIADAEAAAG